MDEAGRYTAEHTVMDANLEIGKLKHLLKVAEDRIEAYLKENRQLINENKELRKKMQEQLSQPKITYADGTKIDSDLINTYDIGKFQKA